MAAQTLERNVCADDAGECERRESLVLHIVITPRVSTTLD